MLDRVDTYGTPIPERKKKAYRGSQVYEKLLAAGTELLTVIEKNKGLANKELSRFTDQIKSLIDKWS